MEIFEATGVQNGEVTGSTLYRYVVDHYERDKTGRITKAVGSHQRLGSISPALAERLLVGGVLQKEIRRFAEGGLT
jgi:pilus assembly protein CpaF